ncbi:MAG TPA: 4-hydroxy-tetrahydrodipicolinate reductase [Gammaproteobacteria bacterium]|nr:4-hydroxy-tetrahydrodipicolinate reductase [Gammaproteobacteria bacterium]
MLKVAVLGAAGRMGRAVLSCVFEADDLSLAGALTEPGDRLLGHDVGELVGAEPRGVPLTDDLQQALNGAQAAVDFTMPRATEANLRACVDGGTALVIGTTGLETRQMKAIEKAAHEVPIVYSRNLSVGVNVFVELVARAAKALADGYDVEIAEAHHRHKVDAPSGTALALGERIAAARGRKLADLAVYSRQGQTGPRVPGTIGFTVVRGGNIVGEHAVRFIGAEEQVEFVHEAQDRKTFARGALRAARWVAGQAPGLYSMADVLGLSRD